MKFQRSKSTLSQASKLPRGWVNRRCHRSHRRLEMPSLSQPASACDAFLLNRKTSPDRLANRFPQYPGAPAGAFFSVGCGKDYRENGYISHAIPTPITRNNASDQTAYLILPVVVCRPRQPKATAPHSAKTTIAAKWLRCTRVPNIQCFRPEAIR